MKNKKVDYRAYINSPKWKEKKSHILKRDKYTCQGCGASKIALDVHHISYERLGNELFTDLVSYCRECHDLVHGREHIEDEIILPHDESSVVGRCDCTYRYFEDKNYAISEYEDRGINFLNEQRLADMIRGHYDGFFIMHHIKGAMGFYPFEAFWIANNLVDGWMALEYIDPDYPEEKQGDQRTFCPMKIENNKYEFYFDWDAEEIA